jgi:hypothetical protein
VQGPLLQRRAGQAAGAGGRYLSGAGDQVIARDGGVRGDDPVQAELDREVGDRVDVGVGEIRRHLDQQRHAAGAGAVQGRPHGGQQRPQPRRRLQVAQPGRVRRADVDHEIVSDPGEQPRALRVVDRRRRLRHGPGLADVDSDRFVTGPAPAQPPGHGGRAVVIEPHPVHQGPVGGQPEQPGPGIAALRAGGHGADLDEREAQGPQRARPQAVLVEARRQPQRPGQVQPEGRHPQHGVAGRQPAAQQPGDAGHGGGRAEQAEAQPVRQLGRQAPEHAHEQQLVHVTPGDHGEDPAR